MKIIKGWFYLHKNKDLIYKNNPNAIQDIRESDLCYAAWSFTGESRAEVWNLLVEASSLGARKERIKKLANDWNCSDEDAKNYANYLNIEIGNDGDSKFARLKNFINLQESPCGFGETYLDAISSLCKELGYIGGKLGWNASFKDLVKQKEV